MERAERMLEEALARLRRAREEGHRYRMRDAAVRAWNAVLEATDALLASRRLLPPEPRTPRDRRRALARLEREEGVQGLREGLALLETLLYRDAFYDLDPDPALLERDIGEAARAYLSRVRSLQEGG